MSARWTTAMVVVLVLALVAVVVAVDHYAPPPEPAAYETATQSESAGGTWTCPVGDQREGTAVAVNAIGPGATGDDPGRIELGTFADGELDLGEPSWIFPGTAVRAPLEGADIAAFAQWYDGPVAVHREWWLQGDDELPPGFAAGPCVWGSTDRWLVPGMSTVGGHEARLRLANPYETDATVAIRLVTPEGPVEPTILQNLTVQGRATTEVEINEHLPERDDVAAEVHVLSGRMAVEGYQLVRQAIGDVDGVSLLASAVRPSATWTVPWVHDGGGLQSWLWVLNPGDRPAPVELTFHGGDGGMVPEGLSEVTVEPGQLRRVDLRGTFPDNLSTGAVTVRSEGAPVVASGAVRWEADDAADTGMAVQLGARPDAEWVFAGGPTAGRAEQLRLANPHAERARVDVMLWNGVELVRSEELTDVEVTPGAFVSLDIGEHLGDVDSWAAFVEASEGEVVAGHVGHGGEEARNLIAGPGAPSAAWGPTGPALAGRHEPGLTQRTGTDPAEGGEPEQE